MSTDIAVLNKEVAELRSLVVKEKTNRLNDSLFSKELAPHYMQLASQLSKSAMVPKAYQGKPQDLFIAMAMGYQMGLSVEQAIQAIAVINGKPCLWGDDMLALCMNHIDFVDIVEEPILRADAVIGYNCTVVRKGMANHTKMFTLDMAKKAGLLSKQGPWTQYPERMLQLRARSFALRDRFPDALKGIKSREEVEDYIDAEYKVVDGSRTEFLKKDLLTKKESNAEINTETSDMGALLSDQPATEETIEDQQCETLGESGVQKVSPQNTDTEISAITPSQSKTIMKLLDEKGFDEARRSKALSYYEVSTISELKTDLADHFIAQLNKL